MILLSKNNRVDGLVRISDSVDFVVKQSIKEPGLKLPSLIVLLFVILTSILPLLPPMPVQAATITWDGGCGAEDTNWSCAENWSNDAVPLATDTFVFDSTSDDVSLASTVDAAFNATETIATLTISAGYTGTITMATTLHVTTAFSQADGFFTAAGQTLDLNGSFTLSAGEFTASSGTTTLAGAMTISAVTPTFSANGGTWTFDGATTATLACGSVSFNSVTFAHTSGTKTVNSDCSLPLGADPIISTGGSITVTGGTLSGTGALTKSSATLTLNAAAVLDGFTGLVTSALTISGADIDLSSYTTVDINGAFTFSSGSFIAPSGTRTVAGAMTISDSDFSHSSGTITFDGATTATLSCNSETLNLVTFAHTGGTKTVGNDCDLPLGNNPTVGDGGSISLSGVLSGSGTLTTTGTFTAYPGASLSGFSGLTLVNLRLAGANLNLANYTTAISGNFTISEPTDLNDDGLIVYYGMDEDDLISSTEMADLSDSGYTGTIT